MRTLLVFSHKNFMIDIEDDDKVTFGPFSPPNEKSRGYGSVERLAGTLRVYKGRSKDDVKAVFTNVTGFRDVDMNYKEEVAREEGAVIWKSDKDGYEREEKVRKQSEWVEPLEIELEIEPGEEEVF